MADCNTHFRGQSRDGIYSEAWRCERPGGHAGPHEAESVKVYEQLPLTSNHSGWRYEFASFLQALELKVEAGARNYGDKSFSKSPERLLDELAAETLDIAGWGFILWVRLQRLKEASQPLREASRLALLTEALKNVRMLKNTPREFRGMNHDNGVLERVEHQLLQLQQLTPQPQVETATTTADNKRTL